LSERDFAAEAAAIEALSESEGDVAVAMEEGVAPEIAAEAIARLHTAEEPQWEIGTWATGSGEGLASMAQVRTLQAAQAWLWGARAADAPGAPDGVRELAAEVEADPNGMGARHAEDLHALRRWLGG